MPQLNVATSVAPQDFPAGTALGQMRFRLFNAANLPYSTLFVDVPVPPVVVFSNVAAGEYTLKIQRLTATGLGIGPEVVQAVSVAAPAPVSGDIPIGVSVTVA